MRFPGQQRWEEQPPPEQKRRLRKGMYILPSLFTAANIGAGYYAISHALQGAIPMMQGDAMHFDVWHFDVAAKAIGVAVVADGLDGRIARMTNTTSAFGRELDSLADVITFGVAPAILAWMWGFRMLPDFGDADFRNRFIQLGLIASFLFLVAGASRLARFNIQVNPQPSNPGRPGRKYFVGLPIPAGAGMIASVVHLMRGEPLRSWWLAPVWLALLVLVGFLMVSTWRFYSFKDLNLRSRHPFQTLILICGVVALIWFYSQQVLFLMAAAYMLSGVLARLAYLLRRKPADPAPESGYKEAAEPR